MYGQHSRRVAAVLKRLGREVELLTRVEGSVDELGNPEESYVDAGETAVCVRTYPNRNTEVENYQGERRRDRAVFVFKREEAPAPTARLRYPEEDGTTTLFELKGETRYETHVEFFGDKVVNK